jgi:hypothetical protein
MKTNRSALMALLAAGGLWAYQNRDKIQGWINNQRGQLSNQYGTEPTTGPTRRIGADAFGSTSPRIYDEPADRQF